jgi:hypothetical protein
MGNGQWVVGRDEGRRVKGIWKKMCGINNHGPKLLYILH